MEITANRLKSFFLGNIWAHSVQNWKATPETLSNAGFYFSPQSTADGEDNCTCYVCGKSVSGWTENDEPMSRHVQNSPSCPLVILFTDAQQLQRLTGKMPTLKDKESARMATFGDWWPHTEKSISAKKMAKAGFVYVPAEENDDSTMCPDCELTLDGWEEGDNPMNEHIKRNPTCSFFAAKKRGRRPNLVDIGQNSSLEEDDGNVSVSSRSRSRSKYADSSVASDSLSVAGLVNQNSSYSAENVRRNAPSIPVEQAMVKRKRGRPRKNANTDIQSQQQSQQQPQQEQQSLSVEPSVNQLESITLPSISSHFHPAPPAILPNLLNNSEVILDPRVMEMSLEDVIRLHQSQYQPQPIPSNNSPTFAYNPSHLNYNINPIRSTPALQPIMPMPSQPDLLRQSQYYQQQNGRLLEIPPVNSIQGPVSSNSSEQPVYENFDGASPVASKESQVAAAANEPNNANSEAAKDSDSSKPALVPIAPAQPVQPEPEQPVKRKRGRPKKITTSQPAPKKSKSAATTVPVTKSGPSVKAALVKIAPSTRATRNRLVEPRQANNPQSSADMSVESLDSDREVDFNETSSTQNNNNILENRAMGGLVTASQYDNEVGSSDNTISLVANLQKRLSHIQALQREIETRSPPRTRYAHDNSDNGNEIMPFRTSDERRNQQYDKNNNYNSPRREKTRISIKSQTRTGDVFSISDEELTAEDMELTVEELLRKLHDKAIRKLVENTKRQIDEFVDFYEEQVRRFKSSVRVID